MEKASILISIELPTRRFTPAANNAWFPENWNSLKEIERFNRSRSMHWRKNCQTRMDQTNAFKDCSERIIERAISRSARWIKSPFNT